MKRWITRERLRLDGKTHDEDFIHVEIYRQPVKYEAFHRVGAAGT
jgi:hypothetical protein